ncbi:MAG TPA: hypothetical protein VGS97_16835 [Actinocrinis sp.]|uniref:hypothetical protein n=1 Tax=Actinocrinis sp. TaxID=1920516 RepID=UPI002DDCB77F|nr:hypothetical protein [Actinocrinis sp.]HEV2345768.1 hypothetical protein [Actinocrinis sp.]
MSVETEAETAPRRRRRVLLTPTRSIPVEFTGERGGEGPLTLGQLNIHEWLGAMPDHAFANLWVELPVPGMPSIDEVTGAAAALIARHESLRTTYAPGEEPRQQVAKTGVQLLEVCSLGEGRWGPRDRPAVAEALVRWLREHTDSVRRPLYMAVAIAPDAGDRVIACAAGFPHLAVDHAAIEILKRDFAGLLDHPGGGQVGRSGHQPLDQAELEATPAEQRRAEAALGYLERQRRRISHCFYTVPGARVGGESLAVELSSVAAAMAVRQIAARTRTSRSSTVLAAVCAVVAHRANHRDVVLPMLSNNRFEHHLMGYVGSLAQSTIASVEVRERGFDELVGHTWTVVMEASRHARYDAVKRSAADELVERERGLRLNYDPLFNSLVPESWSGLTAGVGFQPEQIDIDAALTRTQLRWRPMPSAGRPIRFSLSQLDGCLRLDGWSSDTGLVPRAELESVLLAVERVLVAAASADVPRARMPEIIGLAPIADTPNRILVDSCWVDLADVQRLVEEALAPAVAHVFISADGRPLVAYVTATDTVNTPEQAHARCMAALVDHPTAITPRHYIICDTTPPDPADPTAWPTPSATGSGRS